MKTWLRVCLSLAIITIMILMSHAWAKAAPAAQILQNTPTPATAPTPASTPAPPADPGRGQSMTIMRAEANKTTALPGEEVHFYLRVKSTGTQHLEGLRVVYDAPAGLTLVKANANRGRLSIHQNHLDISVPNLKYGDTAEVYVVVTVNKDVLEGTALVSHFQVHSSYAGSQEAIIGISVSQAKPKMLPQTGVGITILLVGLLLAVALVVIRQFRYRKPTAGA